jgi:vacuolar-type H+-ATPase subunit F/Vma7
MDFFVIGEEELVIGFAFAGVEGRAVSSTEDAREVFREAIQRSDLRVLLLTEEISSVLEEEVIAWQIEGRFPLLVEIPGLRGRMPGRKKLADSIREAIGISI